MSDSNSDFYFSPLPLPHPMKWNNLMPPVQRAVHDLLTRIDGAEKTRARLDKSDEDKKELSNCFLVYGSRGTGKTTVLLNAKDAICSKTFFNEFDKRNDLEKSAAGLAEGLKNILWLDILDLEPLPIKANLLTTLLTRVRNAINSSNCGYENKDTELTSIFEEESDSARQQLSGLIKDATLMWEDFEEEDTRSKANRQVAAADIYASFRDRFKKAIDKLSKELGRHHGLRDESFSIVLPIDNIDRSTDHLQSIVKLAHMVSHRRLWLVMAGDRVEVETFLERAYWKELIHGQGSADAKGKISASGEDETLIMARRQASATAQRLWPTTHRVEIHMVEPKGALNFYPPDENNQQTLYALLSQIVIPTTPQQRKENQVEKDDIHLIDLFDMYNRVPQFFRPSDITNARSLINKLYLQQDPSTQTISDFVREKIDEALKKNDKKEPFDDKRKKLQNEPEDHKFTLAEALNKIIQDEDLWYEQRKKWFENVKLRSETRVRADKKPEGSKIMPGLNRLLLEDVYSEEIEASSFYLTRAAQHGLYLPARSLLDLWRLTHLVINDSTAFQQNFRAEKIARTMLRNAISSSKMSSAMGQRLQYEIISRSEDNGTQLNFYEIELKSVEFTTPGISISISNNDEQSSFINQAKLTINRINDITLNLKREHPSKKYDTNESGSADNYPQPFVIANEWEEQTVKLPSLVSAWLSILFDILMLAEPEIESSVFVPEWKRCSYLVDVQHNVVLKSKNREKFCSALNWPSPEWSTFLASNVFRHQWRSFRKFIIKELEGQAISESEDLIIRLLAANWVACILETFKSLYPIPACEGYIDKLQVVERSTLKSFFDAKAKGNEEESESSIVEFEKDVMKAVVVLYSEIKEMELTFQQRPPDNQELRSAIIDWLENKLPYLFSHLYVPVKKNRCETLVRYVKYPKLESKPKTNLAKYWEENWAFILYDFDQELSKLFPKRIKQLNDEHKAQSSATGYPKYQEHLESIGIFGDLHRLSWENVNKPPQGDN